MPAQNVQAPLLHIPTGFESQQTAIARRQQIAQQILEASLEAGQKGGMTSVAQPIAQIFQAYMGHKMQQKADASQTDLNNHIRDSYLGVYGEAIKDTKAVEAGTMSPTDWMMKHESNPLLAEQTKAMREVATNDLKRGGDVREDGDFLIHNRDLSNAGPSLMLPKYGGPTISYKDPAGMVHTQVNPVGVYAAQARQGLETAADFPTQMTTPLPPGAVGAPGVLPPGETPPILPGAPMGGVPMPGQDPLDPNVLHFLDALKQRGAAQSGSGMFPNPMSAPGQMTSGRRTVAGNTAVGGVPNSHHLDGDAADYVGASPEDLQEYFGNRARVLNEGNHVHVTLPGYGQVPYFGRRGAQ